MNIRRIVLSTALSVFALAGAVHAESWTNVTIDYTYRASGKITGQMSMDSYVYGEPIDSLCGISGTDTGLPDINGAPEQLAGEIQFTANESPTCPDAAVFGTLTFEFVIPTSGYTELQNSPPGYEWLILGYSNTNPNIYTLGGGEPGYLGGYAVAGVNGGSTYSIVAPMAMPSGL